MTLEQILAVVEGESAHPSEISPNDTVVLCSDTNPPVALLYDGGEPQWPYCVIDVYPLSEGECCATHEEAIACYMSHISNLEKPSGQNLGT